MPHPQSVTSFSPVKTGEEHKTNTQWFKRKTSVWPLSCLTFPHRNLQVTGIDTILYNTSVVSLTWQLPGAASQSGPVATNFAVEYSCNGAIAVLHPIEFTNLRATIAISGGITMDAPCTFTVLSRNLNYDPSDPWSVTSTSNGLNVRSDEATIVMFSSPGEPQTLEATGATLNSITIVWTADLLAKATMYQVSYAVVQSGGTRGPELVWSTDVTGLTDTVGGLIEGRMYDITVRARNKNDAGYVPGKTITLSVSHSEWRSICIAQGAYYVCITRWLTLVP